MADIPKLLGIDIGYRAIKMAQVVKDGGSFAVTNLGYEQLSSDVLKDESSQATNFIADKLHEAFKKSQSSTKNCTATVPESMVYSRLITLPEIQAENEKDDTEAEAVYYALKPVIPMELDQVNVSFLEINRFNQGGKNMVNWYVVAAPKTLVEKFATFTKKAGLNLLAIETEALANVRAVKANFQLSNDVLVIDFGANASNIILVRNGNTAFSQSAEVGSEQLTQAIAAEFSVNSEQAERYKVSTGLDFNGEGAKVAQAMTHTVDVLISEVNRTITYSKSKLQSQGVSGIYLIGGGSQLKGLDSYLQSKLSIPTKKVNPFQNFKMAQQSSNVLQQSGGSADFTVSIGLALKGLL